MSTEVTKHSPLLQQSEIRIVTKGKTNPTAEQMFNALMLYLDGYVEDNDRTRKGVIEFTPEGLKHVSKTSFINAIGTTYQKWEAWKSSTHTAKSAIDLRKAITTIEQIFQQADEQRLNVRGNAGDIFRMKVQHGWSEDVQKEHRKKIKAIKSAPSDKLKAVLKRATDDR